MELIRTIWLIAGLLVLNACGQVNVSDTCECGFYTVAGTEEKLHWADGTDLHFKIDSKMPEAFKLAVTQSAHTYNDILVNTKISIDQTRDSGGHLLSDDPAPSYGDEDPQSVNGDGINGIYWVTGPWPWAKDQPNSDAMTSLKFSPTGILEADIYFRAESYPNSKLAAKTAESLYSSSRGFDIQETDQASQWVYVLGLHEMGHALGRVHSKDKISLMFPSIGLNFVKKPFIQEDLDIFETAYKIDESVAASKVSMNFLTGTKPSFSQFITGKSSVHSAGLKKK